MMAACRGIDFGRAGCYNPLYERAWRPRGGPERRTADSFCIKARGSAVSFCLRWYGGLLAWKTRRVERPQGCGADARRRTGVAAAEAEKVMCAGSEKARELVRR